MIVYCELHKNYVTITNVSNLLNLTLFFMLLECKQYLKHIEKDKRPLSFLLSTKYQCSLSHKENKRVLTLNSYNISHDYDCSA